MIGNPPQPPPPANPFGNSSRPDEATEANHRLSSSSSRLGVVDQVLEWAWSGPCPTTRGSLSPSRPPPGRSWMRK
ncbi:hypothetical protein ZHAS_00021454 [Anopheles sinensis]|uniref:Uncharacterized protein n=1 Tax=Anopheles sinensis TaxID=74873 RepID=A0A084WSG1_ANOSI|nr:hypothetical protein ZHAS_00021454 [Anopheles sinensis]